MMKFLSGFLLYLLLFISCKSQEDDTILRFAREGEIIPGACKTEAYFPLLEGKHIGLVCNHTSLIEGRHLLDTLTASGFDIMAVFVPEHGLRGTADAGLTVPDTIDSRTGTRIYSLYGKNKKPTADQLKGIDLVIFDIQDVGVRFYTYLSTLSNVMDACAASDIRVMVIDRPNPNGFYVDGPVLDTSFRSFVGLHPVPVVHGMTPGEYALMVNGEGWLEGKKKCSLEVIPMQGYRHSLVYRLKVKPSPNLPNWQAVYLYPSLCLFEGTVVSVGRGTDKPFQLIGHPLVTDGDTTFVPSGEAGSPLSPPLAGQTCHGKLLISFADSLIFNQIHFNLNYLIGYYRELSPKINFFNAYFDRLAGTDRLRLMIMQGLTDKEIRSSWITDLDHYKMMRKKYLLYPDFE